MIIAFDHFHIMLHCECFSGFPICLHIMLHCECFSGFPICLHIMLHRGCFSGFPIYLGLWICQISEYIRDLNTRGFEYAPKLFPNMPDYAWIRLTILEFGWIFLYLPEWLLISCLLERVVTYFNKVYSLKEHKDDFLNRQNFIFSMVAGSTRFIFL